VLRKVILLGLCVAFFAITYDERDFALGRPNFYCATLATSCRWQSQRSKSKDFSLCLCKVKVGKKKAHPSFTAVLRLIVIFLTEIFELATWAVQTKRKFPTNSTPQRRQRREPDLFFLRVKCG